MASWRKQQRGVAGLLVVLVTVAGMAACSRGGSPASEPPAPSPSPTGTPGDEYQADVLQDFANMSTTLVSYLRTLQNWRKDTVDDQQVAAVAQNMLQDIAQTHRALAARAPLDQAPRAMLDYRLAVDAYAQSAALIEATTAVPRGPLRTQLQLAVYRVQSLADRVFDQGQAELKPYLTPERDIPGVVVHKAPEVPTWAAGAYAPSTPLTDVHGDKAQREYQDTRPQQSFSAWRTLVAGAGLPSAGDEAHAISEGTLAELRNQAVIFTKASDLLYGKPDPAGERLVSTRLQLGLLLDAEATQLGQAAALAAARSKAALRNVAESLAVIGDKLWDDRLGERSTGFADSLLTDLPTAAPAS